MGVPTTNHFEEIQSFDGQCPLYKLLFFQRLTLNFQRLTLISSIQQKISVATDLPIHSLTDSPKSSKDAGLAPLLLTVMELIRQLMEAQIIRRMEAEELGDEDLERASESLRKLEEQVIQLCNIFEIDPKDLNIDLGDVGSLLPKTGSYYPGEISASPTILELLDRLLNTGIVLQGEVDLGLADIHLIHAKLQLVLTSKPL